MAKSRIIYKSKRPKFTIKADSRQWILCDHSKETWYYPNLSNLLDDLAEHFFKKYANKINDIKHLEKAIDKVYDLIERVAQEIDD